MPDVQVGLAGLFAAGNRVAVTLDGVGFFNQFPLHPDVGALFAAKVGEHVLAPTAMPMGVRFAPVVAQRSLALILRVAGLADVSVVWIDNVLLVAPDDALLKERLARFHAAATLVGLTYTEDERGQEVDFLGAHTNWGTGLFNFTERFQDKVAATDLALGADLSLDDLQYVSGLANWVCRLARIPLIRVAPLLQALGTASSDPTLLVPVTPNMRLAWQFCQKAVQGSYLLCPRPPPMASFNLFTDASDLMGGMYVCGNYLPTSIGTVDLGGPRLPHQQEGAGGGAQGTGVSGPLRRLSAHRHRQHGGGRHPSSRLLKIQQPVRHAREDCGFL